ncbi:MAG: hypothetical protein U0235_33525 [Polyangiaceae bacterium]
MTRERTTSRSDNEHYAVLVRARERAFAVTMLALTVAATSSARALHPLRATGLEVSRLAGQPQKTGPAAKEGGGTATG